MNSWKISCQITKKS